jgi:hypothetical protein
MNRLTDAQRLVSPGLAASAAQTLNPRHASASLPLACPARHSAPASRASFLPGSLRDDRWSAIGGAYVHGGAAALGRAGEEEEEEEEEEDEEGGSDADRGAKSLS